MVHAVSVKRCQSDCWCLARPKTGMYHLRNNFTVCMHESFPRQPCPERHEQIIGEFLDAVERQKAILERLEKARIESVDMVRFAETVKDRFLLPLSIALDRTQQTLNSVVMADTAGIVRKTKN